MLIQNVLEVRGNSLTGIVENGEFLKFVPEPDMFYLNDLVVFKENPHQTSIKICKGIPGNQITINAETKEIFVDGKVMDVKFTNDDQIYCWRDWLRFSNTVPENHLFLLGTIPDAIDSRSRGYFSFEQIIGVAKEIKVNILN